MHTEAVGLMGNDVTSTKCILDTLKGHCKPWSNEIIAATAYKELVKGDLGLLEYIEKYKEVTAACNIWHSIWKMLIQCHATRAEKPFIVWEVYWSWGSADICRCNSNSFKVYNSDKQPSIIQSLSATATAANTVQNPSISELHMVQVKFSKKGPSTEDRSQGTCKSCYCYEATPSHKSRSTLPERQSATSVGRRDTSRVVAGQRRKGRKWVEHRTQKESRNQQKFTSWRQKQQQGYGHNIHIQYNTACIHKEDCRDWCSITWRQYKWIVSTRRTTSTSDHFGWIHPKAQVHKFDCEVDTWAGFNIMLLYIYRSKLGNRDQNHLWWSSPGMVTHR